MKRKAIVFILAGVLLLLSACGGSGETVTVESVGDICGVGYLGLNNRFPGIVAAKSEISYKKDENKELAELYVSEGDEVKAGQVLFSYDSQQAELNLEKARLELEQLKFTKSSKESEKSTLEGEKASAPSSEQLSYTLEIQSVNTELKEVEYNISLKEKEVEKLAEELENLEIASEINGKVKSCNPNGGYDSSGSELPFLTIVETGAYRIKCNINEENAGNISEGDTMTVYSRVSDECWQGTVSAIDWEAGTQQSDSSGETEELTSSTTYPFYIELDSPEGLLLGQHVYVEKAGAEAEGLMLPEYYLFDIDGDTASVFAEGSGSKLAKRSVTLGTYDEETCCYEILDGLDAEDYIAFYDESLSAGMKCEHYEETVPDEAYEDYEDSEYSEEAVFEE